MHMPESPEPRIYSASLMLQDFHFLFGVSMHKYHVARSMPLPLPYTCSYMEL